jgi:hypothetical protein
LQEGGQKRGFSVQGAFSSERNTHLCRKALFKPPGQGAILSDCALVLINYHWLRCSLAGSKRLSGGSGLAAG